MLAIVRSMHRKRLALVLLFTLALMQAATQEAGLSDQERRQLIDLIAESQETFLGLLAGVSDEQWDFKPAPDRWSIGECAEHIMRSNESLFASAKEALDSEPDPNWFETTKGKTEFILRVMPNRNAGGAGGATAPQEVRPTGDLSRAEIVQRFRALYEEIGALASKSEGPVKSHTKKHPFPVFGDLNAYDWAIYVPLHTIRHSKQMIEVMETNGYPEH